MTDSGPRDSPVPDAGCPRRRRRTLLLAAVVVLLLALGTSLLIPESRLTLYGWCRGEATYRGLPTSYWGYRLRVAKLTVAQRAPPSRGWEIWQVHVKPRRLPLATNLQVYLLYVRLGLIPPQPGRRLLMEWEDTARVTPVFTQLLRHDNAEVREAAPYTLQKIRPRGTEAAGREGGPR